jgi:hypothetical protein
MALPTNVSYGTVVGQFLLAYGDGPDIDPRPDGVPAKGSIFFRPSPIKLLNPGAEPNPVTILPAVVEAVLDVEGYLLGGDGQRGMRLVATDDEDLNPSGWTWEVEFRLTDQDDVPVRIPAFNIELPGDTEVDLTTVSPVPTANGVFYIVGPQGPANELTIGTVDTLAPEQNATVDITGSSPNQTINFGIPQGFAATVDVGTTTTSAEGTSASVTNSGTTGAAVFNFTIPRGDTGAQGPQGPQGEVGPIGPTGATGIEWRGQWDALVDYVDNDAVFHNGASWFAAGDPPVGDEPSETSLYWFPLALQGATGPQGEAASIAVGTVTTVSPASPATVTNVGTAEDAVFNFEIPKGETGDIGNISATSPITYSNNTIGFDPDGVPYIDGGSA